MPFFFRSLENWCVTWLGLRVVTYPLFLMTMITACGISIYLSDWVVLGALICDCCDLSTATDWCTWITFPVISLRVRAHISPRRNGPNAASMIGISSSVSWPLLIRQYQGRLFLFRIKCIAIIPYYIKILSQYGCINAASTLCSSISSKIIINICKLGDGRRPRSFQIIILCPG